MKTKYHTIINTRFEDTTFGYGIEKSKDFNTGEAQVCDGCKLFISSLEWLPPYEVKVSKKNLGDFVFGTFLGFIASKYFRDHYENTDLLGLSDFKEVEVFYKNEKLAVNYYLPKISLINAFVDLGYIDFEEEDLCDICQKGNSYINRIRAVEFIHPEIIKEDIFFTTALGQANIFVSEKFMEFVNARNFKNVELMDASHFERDYLSSLSR